MDFIVHSPACGQMRISPSWAVDANQFAILVKKPAGGESA